MENKNCPAADKLVSVGTIESILIYVIVTLQYTEKREKIEMLTLIPSTAFVLTYRNAPAPNVPEEIIGVAELFIAHVPLEEHFPGFV